MQDPILLAGPGMKVGYFLLWAPLLGAKRWVQMGPLWWLNGRIFSGTFQNRDLERDFFGHGFHQDGYIKLITDGYERTHQLDSDKI